MNQFSNAEIHRAILRAAEQIEKPRLYSFSENWVSDDCGTPHCIIGWVGHFLGMKGKRVITDVAPVLGLNWCGQLLSEAMGFRIEDYSGHVTDAHIAARLLRDFAVRFQPRTGLPDIVREIFTNPRQTISDTAVDQRFA